MTSPQVPATPPVPAAPPIPSPPLEPVGWFRRVPGGGTAYVTPSNDESSYVEYGVHWIYPSGKEYFVGLGKGDEHRVTAYEMVCEFRETRPNSSVIERTVTVGKWRTRS